MAETIHRSKLKIKSEKLLKTLDYAIKNEAKAQVIFASLIDGGLGSPWSLVQLFQQLFTFDFNLLQPFNYCKQRFHPLKLMLWSSLSRKKILHQFHCAAFCLGYQDSELEYIISLFYQLLT
jgi:hypothetical protein